MTDIDTKRLRELLDRRDEIDNELTAIIAGAAAKKPVTCSKCKIEGHTARTCPQREYDGQAGK